MLENYVGFVPNEYAVGSKWIVICNGTRSILHDENEGGISIKQEK